MRKTRRKRTVNWKRLTKFCCLVLTIAAVIALAVPLLAQEDPATTIERFVLTDPVYTASVPLGTEQSEIAFPAALTATMKDGSTKDVPVSWSCEGYDGESDGTYLFAASFTGYTYAKARPYAMVAVGNGGGVMAPMEETGNQQTLTLTWLSGGTLDEDGVYQIDRFRNRYEEEYNNSSITYQLRYALSGTEDAAPGEIEIRVPASIFDTRTGEHIPVSEVPLPLAPDTGTDQDFNYRIDTATNELVMTNVRTVSAANVFICSLRFHSGLPAKITDGFTNNIRGTAVYAKDGAAAVTSESNELALQYNTRISVAAEKDLRFFGSSDFIDGKREIWSSSWGEAPADAADYVYYVFLARAIESGTQPTTITMTDTPGNGGKIIAYQQSEYSPFIFFDEWKSSYTTQTHLDRTGDSDYVYQYLIVAYPRANLSGSGKVQNTVDVTSVGDDGKQASATKDYVTTYVAPTAFTPPGDFEEISKLCYFSANNGYLTTLRNGKAAVLKGSSNSDNYSFYIGAGVRYPLLTKEEGAAVSDFDSYGKRAYTMEVKDDLMMLGNTILQPGDYEFTAFRMDSYDYYTTSYYAYDDGSGYTTSYDYNGEIPVWVKTEASPVWTQYANLSVTVVNGSMRDWVVTAMDGSIIQKATVSEGYAYGYPDFPLPEGTFAVKTATTSTAFGQRIVYRPTVQLNPTPHVLSIIGEDTESVALTNAAAVAVIDDKGNVVSPATSLSPQVLKDAAAANDAADYGQSVHYAIKAKDLTTVNIGAACFKNCFLIGNDAASRSVKLSYMAIGRSGFVDGGMTPEEQLASGLVEDQRSGTFYDLLPSGFEPDLSTVQVYCGTTMLDRYFAFWSYGWNSRPAAYLCDTSVELRENWRGSGRTMMVVHATAPSNKENICLDNCNYNGSTKGYLSQFGLYFEGSYSWDCIADYGRNLRNSVAYQPGEGEWNSGDYKAYPDDGGTITDNTLMSDLNDDGNPEGTPRNTVYAQTTRDFNYVTSASLDFTKSVKTTGMSGYSSGLKDEATVMAGGSYSYRLRIGSAPNMRTKNIVFYDVLEAHDPANTNRWKGKLESISISQPLSKGIDVIVYYSTSTGITFTEGVVPDISDASVWSVAPPTDLGDVTAIAIDMRKDTGGNEFVLESEQTLNVIFTMRAPLDGCAALVDADACAYNNAWMSGTVWQTNEPESDQMIKYEYTKVHLEMPSLAIEKTADPASGTAEAPTRLAPGEDLDYTLTIRNSNRAEPFANLKIEDTIPDKLTIDVAGIRYRFGSGDWKPMDASVSVTAAGQKLTFTAASLLAGQELQLKIPTSQDIGDAVLTLFVNQAKITGYNGSAYLIESNKTYHDVLQNATAVIRVRKVVENYASDQAGQEFLIGLSGTGCNADTGLALKHNETSLPMTVTLDDVSAQIAVRETVPMEYSLKSISATITHADGAVETQNGASFTVKPGDDVLITVTNTFSHDPFFKADGFVENRFGA